MQGWGVCPGGKGGHDAGDSVGATAIGGLSSPVRWRAWHPDAKAPPPGGVNSVAQIEYQLMDPWKRARWCALRGARPHHRPRSTGTEERGGPICFVKGCEQGWTGRFSG